MSFANETKHNETKHNEKRDVERVWFVESNLEVVKIKEESYQARRYWTRSLLVELYHKEGFCRPA